MKIQVIQLSQYDDSISVREKMSWSQAARILLVWPERGKVLNTRLELNLVGRHAASLGAQVAIATPDLQARFFANQLGIPVFANAMDAQETEWGHFENLKLKQHDDHQQAKLNNLYDASHPKSPAWLDYPLVKVFCLLLIVGAMLALVIFLLPGAKITLTPKVESQVMVFEVIPDPATSSINYSTGSLPVYYATVTVEGQDSEKSSGSVNIPGQPAVGEVEFTNDGGQVMIIKPGAIISTVGPNKISFMITPQADTSIFPYETVSLPVRAIEPGLSGNLAAGKLAVIQGNLDPDLSVTNPEATTGGTERTVAAPTEDDITNLRQHLTGNLMQAAWLKLQSALPAGDLLVTTTITNVATMTETIFPAIGEPGNLLTLSLTMKVEAQALSNQTLSQLVSPIMDAYTPNGYAPRPDSLVFSGLGYPNIGADGKTHWTIRAARKINAVIPTGQAAEMVRGSSVSLAVDRLSTFPLERKADIKLAPGWWPILPLLAMRIEVSQNGVQ